jgi:hypothetical protein
MIPVDGPHNGRGPGANRVGGNTPRVAAGPRPLAFPSASGHGVAAAPDLSRT